MNDIARDTLRQLVAQHGHSLCEDPRRCEALLRDLCGEYQREITVLVMALQQGVAADLLASQASVPQEMLLARLAKRLHENLGLAEDIARWAVETWAVALGVVPRQEHEAQSPESQDVSASPPQVPTSYDRPASPIRRQPLYRVAAIAATLAVLAVIVPLGLFVMRNRGTNDNTAAQPSLHPTATSGKPSSSPTAGHPAVGSTPARTVSPSSLAPSPTIIATRPVSTPTAMPPRLIRYGEEATGTITAANSSDAWTFSAQAGDIVTVRVVQEGGASLRPFVALSDASDTIVGRVTDCYVGREARLQNVQLSSSGTYAIRTEGGCGSIGGYRLSLALKPAPGSIPYGQEVTGKIDLTGDYNDWQFTGQADDIITIRMLQEGGESLPPRFRLLDPGGSELTNQCEAYGQGPYEARLQNFKLRFSGTYTVRASGCFDDSVGGYRLSLTKA